MLSKVLRRLDAGRAQPIVFPVVNLVPRTSARVSAAHPPPLPKMRRSREATRPPLSGKTCTSSRRTRPRSAATQPRPAAGRAIRRLARNCCPIMERLNASIAEIAAMRSDLRRRAERDVVQLALLIARRVLHRQLSVDEGALTAIARVAFERLTRSESYTVTVHPRFAAACRCSAAGQSGLARPHRARSQL